MAQKGGLHELCCKMLQVFAEISFTSKDWDSSTDREERIKEALMEFEDCKKRFFTGWFLHKRACLYPAKSAPRWSGSLASHSAGARDLETLAIIPDLYRDELEAFDRDVETDLQKVLQSLGSFLEAANDWPIEVIDIFWRFWMILDGFVINYISLFLFKINPIFLRSTPCVFCRGYLCEALYVAAICTLSPSGTRVLPAKIVFDFSYSY